MIKVNVYAVGKIKEKYLKDGIDEYSKRISKFAKFNIIEIEELKLQNRSETEIKEKEGEMILSKIKDSEFVILLDLNKKEFTSEELASKIEELIDSGKGEISFVIGGSLGLGENIKKRGNLSVTFSKLTFPHQLIRMFLCEQIYRSFKIINNESYHH